MSRQYLSPYINFQGRARADVGWLTDKFGLNWMVSIDKA